MRITLTSESIVSSTTRSQHSTGWPIAANQCPGASTGATTFTVRQWPAGVVGDCGGRAYDHVRVPLLSGLDELAKKNLSCSSSSQRWVAGLTRGCKGCRGSCMKGDQQKGESPSCNEVEIGIVSTCRYCRHYIGRRGAV